MSEEASVPSIPKRMISAKQQSSEANDPRVRTLLAQNPYYSTQQGDNRRKPPDSDNDGIKIVLGDDESTNDMIPLGIRQPSFRSIGTSMILKGGSSFTNSGISPAPVPPSGRKPNESTNCKTVRERMQMSMEAMNRNIWQEIGYNPSEIGTTK